MNAGSPQKVSAQDFINAVEQFQKKCEAKTVKKQDVEQFAVIIQKTRTLNLSKLVAASLEGLKKTMGNNKAILESAAGAVPTQNLITKIDDLSRYLKEEENKAKQVTGKNFDGLPKR